MSSILHTTCKPYLKQNWSPPDVLQQNPCVRGAPWSAANRLHGQRTGAFSWRPVLGLSRRPTNSGSTLPRTAHLDGGTIGCNQCIPTHSGNAPASPDIQPTTWFCPACLPSTNSIPAPIQPTIAMTTTHIHQLWITRPPSTRSSSASEDYPQAPVVTQQQKQQQQRQEPLTD